MQGQAITDRYQRVQSQAERGPIEIGHWYKVYHILKIPTELTRSMVSCSSRARPFYIHLLKQHASGEMFGHRALISRVKLTCEKNGISFLKYIDDDYFRVLSRIILRKGCAESVRLLLGNKKSQNRIFLKLMLHGFWYLHNNVVFNVLL